VPIYSVSTNADVCVIGNRHGRFRIIKELGSGGAGKVYLARRSLAGGLVYSHEVYAVKVAKKLQRNVELEVFNQATGHPYLVQMLTFFETKVCSSYLNVCVFSQLTDTEIEYKYQYVATFLQVYICEVLYWPLVVTTLLVIH